MILPTDTHGAMWQHGNVGCWITPSSVGYDVELRNDAGVAFLRKSTASSDAARNEAEYLRLLMGADAIPLSTAQLRPFALIVDNDADNCEAFAQALRGVGVRALGVRTGFDALRLARDLTPDLIVIDYKLPDLGGAEVCRRLRDDPETEPLPIIAVTGAPETVQQDGCVADAVLAKPCGLDTFIAAARLFLRPAAGD
jgi:CheY-like chemotaxis protein